MPGCGFPVSGRFSLPLEGKLTDEAFHETLRQKTDLDAAYTACGVFFGVCRF